MGTPNKPAGQLPRLRPAMPDVIKWQRPSEDEIPEIGGTEHFHWTVLAFQRMTDDGTFMDSVTINVEAPTEELALARAMRVVHREWYRVNSVTESCQLDKEAAERRQLHG